MREVLPILFIGNSTSAVLLMPCIAPESSHSVILVLLSLDVVLQEHLNLWVHLGPNVLQEKASYNC